MSTTLASAAGSGDLEKVRALLEKGTSPNAAGNNGNTPLVMASQNGHTEVVRLLLEKGADPNILSANKVSCLILAVSAEHKDVVELLLEGKANVNLVCGDTPIFKAVQRDNLEIVKLLVKHGATLGMTAKAAPLYLAAQHGNTVISQFLLDSGADVNVGRPNGSTPLFVATNLSLLDEIKVLMDAGADPNIAKENGMTPLFYACKNGLLEVVKSLLKAGAKIETQTEKGLTPLLLAVKNSRIDIMKALIDSGADVNRNVMKETPILMALKYGDSDDVAKFLLDNKADYTVADEFGRNALHLATVYGYAEIWSTIRGLDGNYDPVGDTKKEPTSTSRYANQEDSEKEEETSKYRNKEDFAAALTVPEVPGMQMDRKLGSGAFGDVWRATSNGQVFAVKFLQRATDKDLEEMLEELSILGGVKHKNIIMHKMFLPEIPAIVMEIAEMGNMNEFLLAQTKPIGWNLRMKWAMELTNAIVHMHQSRIVHRDIRTVNLLLSSTLEVKISDFGISIWRDEGGEIKKKPFYSGHKGIYEIKNAEESYEYNFDLRLLGICLTKTLLYGKNLNTDLYDYKSASITSEVSCDIPDFMDFIKFCFEPIATAPLAAAYARSICLHHLVNLNDVTSKAAIDTAKMLKNYEVAKPLRKTRLLIEMGTLGVKDTSIAMHLLKEQENSDGLIRRHATASLSSLPPTLLKETFALLTKIDRTVNKAENTAKHLKLIATTTNIKSKAESLVALGNYDMTNAAAIELLLNSLRDPREWKYRNAAALALRKAPQATPEIRSRLVAALKDEKNDAVLMEIVTTVGELKIPDEEVSQILQALLAHQHQGVRRRTAVALCKILGHSGDEGLRTKAAAELCSEEKVDSWEERVYISEGLFALKLQEESVLVTLLRLLDDENELVKKAAGKALSALQGGATE